MGDVKQNEKTFTESLNDLQKAAGEIGKQTTTLEESIALFKQGMEDAEHCKRILAEASQQIEIYSQED